MIGRQSFPFGITGKDRWRHSHYVLVYHMAPKTNRHSTWDLAFRTPSTFTSFNMVHVKFPRYMVYKFPRCKFHYMIFRCFGCSISKGVRICFYDVPSQNPASSLGGVQIFGRSGRHQALRLPPFSARAPYFSAREQVMGKPKDLTWMSCWKLGSNVSK